MNNFLLLSSLTLTWQPCSLDSRIVLVSIWGNQTIVLNSRRLGSDSIDWYFVLSRSYCKVK